MALGLAHSVGNLDDSAPAHYDTSPPGPLLVARPTVASPVLAEQASIVPSAHSSDSAPPMFPNLEMGPRCSNQTMTTPAHLKDFNCNTVWTSDPSYHSVSSSASLHTLSHYINYNNFSAAHRHFLASISATTEPTRFYEAVSDPCWWTAI